MSRRVLHIPLTEINTIRLVRTEIAREISIEKVNQKTLHGLFDTTETDQIKFQQNLDKFLESLAELQAMNKFCSVEFPVCEES